MIHYEVSIKLYCYIIYLNLFFNKINNIIIYPTNIMKTKNNFIKSENLLDLCYDNSFYYLK